MHTVSLYKRYILVAALTMIALAVLTYLLQVFAGINLGSASGIVAVMVPAMDAGQAYAKRWGKRPENGYAWKVSGVFTLLNVAVSALLAVVMFAVLNIFGEIWELLASVSSLTMAVITAVLLAIYWAAGRFFFGFGAKNHIKAQERLAAKKEP